MSTPITPAHRPKKRKNLWEATTLFLTKATTAVQWKPDESDAFGIITANKLKEMSEEQRQFAESLLPEVLNQGVRGELTRYTHMSHMSLQHIHICRSTNHHHDSYPPNPHNIQHIVCGMIHNGNIYNMSTNLQHFYLVTCPNS